MCIHFVPILVYVFLVFLRIGVNKLYILCFFSLTIVVIESLVSGNFKTNEIYHIP